MSTLDSQIQTSTSTIPTITDLPKDKPLIFTNLLRFHPQAKYTSPPPPSTLVPTPATGADVYWTRYFPIYHAACVETLGSSSSTLQKVLYKGTPLVPLKPSSRSKSGSGDKDGLEDAAYWHAVVVTRVENWEVAERVGGNETYQKVGRWHREAAVEDDVLYVSCAVEGFEVGVLE